LFTSSLGFMAEVLGNPPNETDGDMHQSLHAHTAILEIC
jgi:hypothetical protein